MPGCWRRASCAGRAGGRSEHGSRLIRRLAAAIAAALTFTGIGVGAVLGAGTANDDFYGITFPFVLEDQPFSVAAPGILGNDNAGAGETLCLVSPPTTSTQGGTVGIGADGSFTYTSPSGYAGPDSFTYGVAVSGGGLCPATADDTATVNLTVAQVNDKPALELVGDCAGGVTALEDSGGYLGEDVCVALDPGPANESTQELVELLLDTSGDVAFQTGPTITLEGFLQFRPAPNDHGTSTVTIRGRDNGGTANGGQDLSAPIQLTITIEPVPDAPVANADAFAALKDRTLNIGAPGVLANDSDADGSALAAILVSSPVHGVLTLGSNGSFSYTPAAGYVGPDAFSYRASDGSLSSATRVVTLTVTAVPLPSPTPVVSLSPTVEPSLQPSAELTAEPTLEAPPTADPGTSAAPTPVAPSASAEPGRTPEPDPTADARGPSLPLVLVAVLFGVLLVFAAAYYVPRWLNASRN